MNVSIISSEDTLDNNRCSDETWDISKDGVPQPHAPRGITGITTSFGPIANDVQQACPI